ncbi:quaternary ammonium compound efflux SMR transporter SugE, partial [Aliarcobacter butzleri]|uniref:quaternary ammonium compound efflux SMR transporter SugE n=1 Tax=Aliarcobacter butzleri TaxID=28197 RepID=UPI00263DED67
RNFMSWGILVLAGIFEIFWAVGLKYTDGFTKLIPSLFTIIAMLVSFWLLSFSLKTLPLGTAYAVWVGIGTIGTVIAGIMLFGDSINIIRIISIAFIILGIIGLKITTA